MTGLYWIQQKRRSAAAWLHCAIVLLLRLAAPANGQPVMPEIVDVPIEVDEAVVDWALDLNTGRLFAAWMSQGVVAEYDPASGQELRRFTVGQEPRRLVVKGPTLVVTTLDPKALWFIDLERNQVQPPLELLAEPEALFSSAADNPFVYVLGELPYALRESPGSIHTIWQIDTRERRTLGSLQIDEHSLFHARQANMSFDGRALLVNKSYLFAMDETSRAARQLPHFSDFRKGGPLSLDQNSRYWSSGGNLYPMDLRIATRDGPARRGPSPLMPRKRAAPLRTYKGSPIALHPTLDLVAGVVEDKTQSTLVLQTFRGGEELARIALNNRHPADRSGRHTDVPNEASLVFDAARHRLIYGWAKNAHVIQLPKTGLAKPLLELVTPAWLDLAAGHSLTLPLRVSDGREDTTFRAIEGPKGLHVEGDSLAWQPGSHDVGAHRIRIAAAAADETDEAEVQIRVTRPFIDLGLFAGRVVLDEAATRAAVIGWKEAQLAVVPTMEPATELAIVDLATQRVLSRRSFPDGIRLVHLDSQRLYLVPGTGSLFHTLHIEDLTNDRRFFFDRPVTGFASLPGDKLLVIAEDTLKCYDSAGLTEAPCPGCDEQALPFDMQHRGQQLRQVATFRSDAYSGLVVRVNDGVAFNGVVLDDTGGLRSAYFCERLPVVGEPIRGTLTPSLRTRDDVPPRLWGRELSARRLLASNTNAVATFAGPSVLLRHHPLVATAKLDRGEDGSPDAATISLIVSELVEGRPIDKWMVCDVPEVRGLPLIDLAARNNLYVHDGGESVIVVVVDRAYVIPFEPDRLADVPVPVHFLHPSHALAAKAGEAVDFMLSAAGGKGKLRFRLATQQPGVTLDATTGKVHIDTETVWQRFREQARQSMFDLPDVSSNLGRGVETMLTYGRKVYQRLLGKPTSDVPVALTLRWEVQDEDGQEDRLTEQIIIVGPQADFDAAVAEGRHEQAR